MHVLAILHSWAAAAKPAVPIAGTAAATPFHVCLGFLIGVCAFLEGRGVRARVLHLLGSRDVSVVLKVKKG